MKRNDFVPGTVSLYKGAQRVCDRHKYSLSFLIQSDLWNVHFYYFLRSANMKRNVFFSDPAPPKSAAAAAEYDDIAPGAAAHGLIDNKGTDLLRRMGYVAVCCSALQCVAVLYGLIDKKGNG